MYDYQNIDDYVLNIPEKEEKSIESLRNYLLKGSNNDFEKVRSACRWIAENIEYDIESYFKISQKRSYVSDILKARKAVCSGYSRLFEKLLTQSEIEVVTISGYGKGYRYSQGNKFSGTIPNHAWNAVKIENKWYLVDVTWAAGGINKNKRYVKEFDETYFLTPPEHFIFNHFPEEQKWQLLDKPISLEEFENQIYLRPSFFAIGFPVEQVRFCLKNKYFRGFPDIYKHKRNTIYIHNAPIEKFLNKNNKYYFQIAVSNATEVVIINNKKWCRLNEKNSVYFGEIDVKPGDLKISVKYPQKSSYHYWCILKYIVE